MRRHARGFTLVLAAAVLASAAAVWAQAPKSVPVVKEFVALAGAEMRYVAAKIPDAQDEYVAALHIPGVQLIVVWSRYEQPTLLDDMLRKRDHQGVYTDLNSASYAIAASRAFSEDLREDGLFPKRTEDDGPFDSYEGGGKRIAFDGDWKKQKLSEKEYQDAFTAADERYTKAVSVLLTELKKGS
jgi:hypothetical protein